MKPFDILSEHHLKRTSCREGILEVIIHAGKALSEHEIRSGLGGRYDRTTFYRSFKTLEERGIIHRIVVDNQIVKYAIDNSITQRCEHVHFYCNHCQSVECLETVPVQPFHLPEGYTEQHTDVIVKGTCAVCRNL